MTSLPPGHRLGPYEIVEMVGAGGMGQVYRAHDSRLNRTVALKVSDERFSDRFDREARAVAQLNHPHICQLYDVGPNYLVMEFVEGSVLGGPLPIDRVVTLATQILDAVDAAHRRGITHRDLKPANILVTPQGIKLLDFGLAKPMAGLPGSAQDATTPPLTGAGQIVGTLQYMAPEQLQGKEVDGRSDLFSFGCVLYEMLTGARAFDGGDPASVIAAVLTREAPSVAAVAPSLDRIVRRSLAKDPDQRFQTARDLKAALLWAMEQPAAAVRKRGAVGWPLIAAVLVAAVSIAAGWAVARWREPAVQHRVVHFEINPPIDGRFTFGTNTGGIGISPDGSTVVFVASVEGRNRIWVRGLDDTKPRLLPGTEDAGLPFWSPDGRTVGFISGTTLKRIELAGGLPLAVCAISGSLRGATWTERGDIIYGTNASGLWKVPASGGTPTALTTSDPERESFHGFPQRLPGERFLYFVRASSTEQTGIYLTSLASPPDRVFLLQTEGNALVAGTPDGAQYLLWTRGGTLLAQAFDAREGRLTGEPHPIADNIGTTGITGAMNVAASAGGVLVFSRFNVVSQLTWMDRAGAVVGLVGEPSDYNTFDLSSDGQRVVASQDRAGGSDLWLLESARGNVGTRITSRYPTNVYPVWSPDGFQVVFGTGGMNNLFRKAISGGAEEVRLTRSARTQLPLDWSRDGSTILIYEIGKDSKGRDLSYVDPRGGETQPVPYLHSPYNEWWARFSPEPSPRWVAYQADDSGRWEIYIDTFPTPGNRRQVSTGGGQFPQWGPAGRELFFLAPDGMLMAVDVTLGGPAADSSSPKSLFRLPVVDTGRSPYAVAPDGRRLLVRAIPTQAPEPLTAIVNWPSLLGAKPE